jgi:hypothetical protein
VRKGRFKIMGNYQIQSCRNRVKFAKRMKKSQNNCSIGALCVIAAGKKPDPYLPFLGVPAAYVPWNIVELNRLLCYRIVSEVRYNTFEVAHEGRERM